MLRDAAAVPTRAQLTDAERRSLDSCKPVSDTTTAPPSVTRGNARETPTAKSATTWRTLGATQTPMGNWGSPPRAINARSDQAAATKVRPDVCAASAALWSACRTTPTTAMATATATQRQRQRLEQRPPLYARRHRARLRAIRARTLRRLEARQVSFADTNKDLDKRIQVFSTATMAARSPSLPQFLTLVRRAFDRLPQDLRQRCG
jgi:hypothetical protein